jgi:DNA-binding GntR family transcriptional regulator
MRDSRRFPSIAEAAPAVGGSDPLPLGRTAKSLPAQVADRLIEEIVTGRMPPGERLKEIALAQRHAVSRATIRDALAILERRGLVERVPRIGARVTGGSKDEVYELFEIRGVLLGLAARRVAETATEALLGEFSAMAARIEALATRSATRAAVFAEHSIAAQQFLMTASGSRSLADLYEQLSRLSAWRLIRARAISFGTEARRRESATDWGRMRDALERRDPDAAEEAARSLIAHSGRAVRAQLEHDVGRTTDRS